MLLCKLIEHDLTDLISIFPNKAHYLLMPGSTMKACSAYYVGFQETSLQSAYLLSNGYKQLVLNKIPLISKGGLFSVYNSFQIPFNKKIHT